MVWKPLAVETLPRILCGPILRRVESGSVTVWLALHHKSSDDENKTILLQVFLKQTSKLVMSGSIAPTRIGDVYVATVQATGGPLLHSSHYKYRILFGETVVFGDLQNLGEVPTEECSFQFIPKELSEVRIAHASCRKPDGGGRDALAILHTAITDNASSKPHLLLLTGDQIYADGVGAPLLLMILDAAKKLLGNLYDDAEVLPQDTSEVYETFPLRRIPWLESAQIRHSYPPHSHLVSFAEYFMMYLFAWSEVLWGDAIPTVAQARPILGIPADRDYNESERLAWQAQGTLLDEFRSELPSVRKLLQTTPTLMIFDDHDVTDDWRINRRWIADVLKTELGSRIELNALLAYMINQASGNDPEQFQSKIESIFVGGNVAKWRSRDDHGGLGDILGWNASGALNQTAIKFHYSIQYPAFHLVVLDTRTRRGYGSTLDSYPSLIDEGSLATEIGGSDDSRPLILVSPAPVWGYAVIEAVQEGLAEHPDANTVVARSLLEYSSVQHVKTLDPLLHRDAESWALNPRARQRLVGAIMAKWKAARFVVVLSGDVHYGFTATIDVPAPIPKQFIQLTSSAVHNQEVKAWVGAVLNVKWGERTFTYDNPPLYYNVLVNYHSFDPSPPRKSFLQRIFPQLEDTKPLETPKLMPKNNCGVVQFGESTITHLMYFKSSEPGYAVNTWTIPLSK